MAAPQSAKRGFRRVKGLVLVKQWASPLEEETLTGGVVVRFTWWWMGERSDVGGATKESAVEAIAVSKKRIRYGIIVVHGRAHAQRRQSVAGE